MYYYYTKECVPFVYIFPWTTHSNIEWRGSVRMKQLQYLHNYNDFSSEKMTSFQLNISRSELTLICGYYLRQVVKVNWQKNQVKINVHWWHWHYFIVYISNEKVYQVNYKEESFAWKYIQKFAATNKLTWKFAGSFLTTKLSSHKVYCWCLHKFD